MTNETQNPVKLINSPKLTSLNFNSNKRSLKEILTLPNHDFRKMQSSNLNETVGYKNHHRRIEHETKTTRLITSISPKPNEERLSHAEIQSVKELIKSFEQSKTNSYNQKLP